MGGSDVNTRDCSLLAARCSLLAARCSLLAARCSLLAACGCALLTPGLAEGRDDEDTPDDLEWDDYFDDGEPLEDEPPEETCSLEPPMDIWVDWTLGTAPSYTLPPVGTGNTWTIDYRARGRDVDISWTEAGQGSPTQDAVQYFMPPSAVSAAAATTPLVIMARAVARDATDAEVDLRYVQRLILDARSGQMQYERWEDHVWPTITNPAGETFVIADLDWDPETAIPTTADESVGSMGDTSDTGLGFGSDDAFFPEAMDLEVSGTAATVAVTVCVGLKVDFMISEYTAGVRQDYFDNNEDKFARGHWIYVSGPATPQMYGWASWRSVNGSTPGCTTLSLQSGARYDIWMRSDLLINAQTADVRKSSSTGEWQTRVMRNYLAPTYSKIEWVQTSIPHEAWNVSSVLSWGMYRRKVPGFMGINIYTHEECPKGASKTCAYGRDVYLEPSDGNRRSDQRDRFVIAHEIGHVVGYVADDRRSPAKDYGVANVNDCVSTTTSHRLPSKEYASAAAVEGFADYWAAVVFNNTAQADCALDWFSQNFDGQNGRDGLPGKGMQPMNCRGKPYWGATSSYIEQSADHLGDQCSGPKANRGNEFDWMRMFWHLDDGLSFSTILEVWDRANPKNWRRTDAGTADKPWERIIDAARKVSPAVRTRFVNEGSVHGTSRL